MPNGESTLLSITTDSDPFPTFLDTLDFTLLFACIFIDLFKSGGHPDHSSLCHLEAHAVPKR